MRIVTLTLALSAVLALGSIQPLQAHNGWSGTWGSYMGVPLPCFPGYPIDPQIVSCIRERGTYHCCPQLYSPYHVRELMPPDVAGKLVLDRLTALCVPRKIIEAEKAPEVAPKPREDEKKPDEKKPDDKKPDEKNGPEVAPKPRDNDNRSDDKRLNLRPLPFRMP
jgi:hypothetical protein